MVGSLEGERFLLEVGLIVAGFPCPSALPHTHVRMCSISLELEVINKEKRVGSSEGTVLGGIG